MVGAYLARGVGLRERSPLFRRQSSAAAACQCRGQPLVLTTVFRLGRGHGPCYEERADAGRPNDLTPGGELTIMGLQSLEHAGVNPSP